MAAPKVTLSQAGAEYMRHKAGQLQTESTLKGSRIVIKHLAAACRTDIAVASITHRHVDDMFAAGSWAASTRNLYIVGLRQFFNWCKARRYMSPNHDPLYGYRASKVPVEDHTRVPPEQWPKLWAQCDHPLDRIIIATGLFTMLRGGEMANLRVEDVDLSRGELRVYRVKTKEFDTLPICSELDTELRRWMTWYASRVGDLKPTYYLLPARERDLNGQSREPTTGRLVAGWEVDAAVQPRIKITRMYNYVRPVLVAAGFHVKGDGGHTLRRSGARALFDELCAGSYDGALRRVQSMLGHASSKTTEVYLGLRLDRIQRNEEIIGKPMFTRYTVMDDVTPEGVTDLTARRTESA